MSKTIVPPVRQQVQMKSKLVRLWFNKDESVAPDGHYRMIGGMLLPSSVKLSNGNHIIKGYAMIAGRHEDSKVIYVFDETEWVTVDHVLDPEDGSVMSDGFVIWWNKVWSQFFARQYAHRQDDETLFRYMLDFNRCSMMQPKPSLLDAEWNDDAQPMSIINRELLLGRLKMKRSSILIRELDQFRADPYAEAKNYPSVHALQCCMSVLDRYWA